MRVSVMRMLGAAAIVAIAGCTTQAVAPPPSAVAVRYDAVIDNPLRTDQDRRTDAARKPAELLPFMQVRPGMAVLDVSAGGGYTSQLLALAVGPTGKLYAQTPRPGAASPHSGRDSRHTPESDQHELFVRP